MDTRIDRETAETYPRTEESRGRDGCAVNTVHDDSGDPAAGSTAAAPELCRPARYGLMAFGWLNVALGVIGLMVPVMPTTIFLIIALWAFSRC